MTKTNEMKKALKKKFRNAKFSITHKYGGYSDSYNVRTDLLDNKDFEESKPIIKEIEKIVGKYESIDRDERTGEILAGGNTYIFVSKLN